MMRDMIQKFPRKRLSCGPLFFSKKLQKSREISNFTAFCGGLEGDRTLDLCDANAALSQLSYEPKLILQRQMLLYHNFLHCKDCFFQKDENFLLPICR